VKRAAREAFTPPNAPLKYGLIEGLWVKGHVTDRLSFHQWSTGRGAKESFIHELVVLMEDGNGLLASLTFLNELRKCSEPIGDGNDYVRLVMVSKRGH
jgi:hypothetical protein